MPPFPFPVHGLPVADNATNTSNVCTPGQGRTEVVCANCGSHLGDYFDDQVRQCVLISL